VVPSRNTRLLWALSSVWYAASSVAIARAQTSIASSSPVSSDPASNAPATEVTVVARRPLLEHARRDPTLATTVLSGAELHRAGQSASDVLARVPGVQVARTGAQSDLSTASIRGADSSQVPVYLAGVRINDDVSGIADLSTVPLWMIERVEVYRGNAPELGDRLGMGGAVFFWPRLPQRTRAGASAELGSFGERGGWLAYEAGSPRAGSLVAIRRSQADNDYPYLDDRGQRFDLDEVEVRRDNADYRTHDAWAIGRVQLLPETQLSLVVNAFDREQGLTGLGVVPAEHARGSVRRLLGGASLRTACALGERCQLEAQVSLLAARLTFDDPFIELPSLRTRWLHDAGTRLNLSARGTVDVSDAVQLGLSANQSVEDLDIVRLDNLPRSAQRASSRLLAFGAWQPRAWLGVHALAAAECHTTEGRADRFGVPLVVRSEPCSTFQPSGRLGVRVAVGEHVELLANAGRYVRVPTLGELYGSTPLVDGSASLDVERGYTADAGLRTSLTLPAGLGHAAFETFAFARFASDLIRFRRTGLSSAAPYNVASARILGGEAALAGELFDALAVTATATVLDPRETTRDPALDPTPNDVLPLMSKLTASVRAEVFALPGWRALGQDRMGLALAYLHRSTRFDDPAGLTVLPEQNVFDLEATSSHFEARLLARVALRNVFDARQLDLIGLPVPGRSVAGELELWF